MHKKMVINQSLCLNLELKMSFTETTFAKQMCRLCQSHCVLSSVVRLCFDSCEEDAEAVCLCVLRRCLPLSDICFNFFQGLKIRFFERFNSQTRLIQFNDVGK